MEFAYAMMEFAYAMMNKNRYSYVKLAQGVSNHRQLGCIFQLIKLTTTQDKFSTLLALCEGNLPVPQGKGPVMRQWFPCDEFSISLATLIARFMGPTWGPSGTDRTQVGPMLAPWTLLSGLLWRYHFCFAERHMWPALELAHYRFR